MCAVQLRPSCLPLSFSCGAFHVKVNSCGKHACVPSCFSPVRLFVILWAVARQAPLSTRFSRREYWSGLPCPPPGDLPEPGIEPLSLTNPALAGGFFTTSTTWEACGKHGRGKKEEAFPSGDWSWTSLSSLTPHLSFFLTSHPPSSPPLSWGRWGCV